MVTTLSTLQFLIRMKLISLQCKPLEAKLIIRNAYIAQIKEEIFNKRVQYQENLSFPTSARSYVLIFRQWQPSTNCGSCKMRERLFKRRCSTHGTRQRNEQRTANPSTLSSHQLHHLLPWHTISTIMSPTRHGYASKGPRLIRLTVSTILLASCR
jgi:hypothetical protein